ncbi:AraC family transcriptional regulator [Bacteroides sp. 519]|uniref:helix-turn-helix domain-containing protein n=1 Tax=Bacteroides sp. 519 TaxID=2302937 RepID=UPI0013D74036|nr:helix-turn-helix domain-containing protein [Bacteroides sp. 519]
MKKPYRNLTSESMSSHPSLASLSNSIILLDNLEKDIIMSEKEKSIHMNNPIKYISTMTVLLCIDGTIDFGLGLQNYRMEKNDSLFMKSGIICELQGMSDGAKFCSIVLNEEFYYPVLNNFVSSTLQKSFVKNPICSLSDIHMEECVFIYKLIKNRLSESSQDILLGEIIKGYIQALLYNLYSGYITQEEGRNIEENKITRKQDLYNRFMELVQRDFIRERNIKYYANQLCITPRYLSQVVYKESGHYASEHIDNFVITEAKQLVRGRQYSILQISKMLNFTSLSFFGRYFKKNTGYSPTQYQNLEWQESII